MLRGIRAVFFDAVGTVLFPNPSAHHVYAEVADRHGVTADPQTLSARLWERFRAEAELDRRSGWLTSEARERERWRNVVFAAIPDASDALFEELFRHFAGPTAWRAPADAGPNLAALERAGLALGMGSNYDSRLRSVVHGTPELRPLRDRLVISSEVGVMKPGGAFFDAVAQAAGCDRGDILFVGDDVENDYDGATQAGMRAVLIDPNDKHPQVERRVRTLGELVVDV